MSTERQHHPYSPSKLQNLEACACFDNQQGKVHIAAEKGTIQHNVVEAGEDDVRLDDDEALAAAECLDFYEGHKQLFVEARERAHREEAENRGDGKLLGDFPEVIEISEEYLKIDSNPVDYPTPDGWKTAEGTTAGYIDKALISHTGTEARMYDWKFGKWAVEDADNNLQGMSYFLGLLVRFPALERVTFYFKQPALNRITSATWTKADVAKIYLRISTVVQRAITARRAGDFSMANPTVPGCLFCAHKGKCPKVVSFVCNVGAKFYPLEMPEVLTPTYVLDPANAAKALRLAQIVETWAGAFKRQTNDRVLRGDSLPPEGYALTSRSDREVVDPAKFREITLQHLTEAELAEAAQYTFGTVEKKINDKTPRGMKKATVEAYQKELLDSGAVKRGQPYAFLRVVTASKESTETGDKKDNT